MVLLWNFHWGRFWDSTNFIARTLLKSCKIEFDSRNNVTWRKLLPWRRARSWRRLGRSCRGSWRTWGQRAACPSSAEGPVWARTGSRGRLWRGRATDYPSAARSPPRGLQHHTHHIRIKKETHHYTILEFLHDASVNCGPFDLRRHNFILITKLISQLIAFVSAIK